MLKLKKLERFLKNDQSLLAVDWNDLNALKQKYPFSNLLSMVTARKHFLENGELSSEHFKETLLKNNNAGISLASMPIFSNPLSSDSKSKRPTEELNLIKEDSSDKENISLQTSLETAKQIRSNPADPFIKTDFTQWLLSKNIALKSAEGSEEDLNISEETQNADGGTDLKDEIISESLAEIYSMQGLKEESIKMYQKLSLKNPKKSAYFAEIIENLKKS